MLGPDQYMLGCVRGAGDFVIMGGRVAAPDRVLDDGWVAVSDGRIAGVGSGTPPSGEHVDVGGALVVPGFVDTHCHGGGGGLFTPPPPRGTPAGGGGPPPPRPPPPPAPPGAPPPGH